MAKLVHGSDAFASVYIAPRDSSSDDPAYTSEYSKVPLAGSSMQVERDTAPQLEEIAATGALVTLDYGRGFWRGSFRTIVQYNAPWFHYLLCQLMGGLEGVTVDRTLNGNTPGAGTYNAHWYFPQSWKCTTANSVGAITHGMVIRAEAQGPDNSAGTIFKVGGTAGGCYVVGVTFEQTAGEWLTANWEILGPEPTMLAGTGVAAHTFPANLYPVRPLDLSKDNTHPVMPSASTANFSQTTSYIDRLSVTIRNGLDYPPRMATAYDVNNNIGHVEPNITATASFEASLTQSAITTTIDEFIASIALSSAELRRTLRWISAKTGSTHSAETPMCDVTRDVPYALEIGTSNAKTFDAQASVESPNVLKIRWNERWFDTVAAKGGTGYPWATSYHMAAYVAVQVADSDDATGTKFNIAAEGGNDPHSTLS